MSELILTKKKEKKGSKSKASKRKASLKKIAQTEGSGKYAVTGDVDQKDIIDLEKVTYGRPSTTEWRNRALNATAWSRSLRSAGEITNGQYFMYDDKVYQATIAPAHRPGASETVTASAYRP